MLLAHTAACVLAVAIVPALLYVRIGYRQVNHSDWLLARIAARSLAAAAGRA